LHLNAKRFVKIMYIKALKYAKEKMIL
jgi:hypothetical protein